jgi:Na+:H+ antiporter
MGIVVLSLVVAFARSGQGATLMDVALIIGRMTLYFIGAILVGRWLDPLIERLNRLGSSQGVLSGALVVAFVYAWGAEYVGQVAAITGSYLAGVLFGQTRFKKEIDQSIHAVTYSMLVPVFFISIGLQANGRELGSQALFTVLLVIVAIATKAIGCGVFARATGFTTTESIRVGAGMISRGEVGLIVAGYGLANGIIGRDVFSASVLVVLVTTMVTPPLLRMTFQRVSQPLAMPIEETIGHRPEGA